MFRSAAILNMFLNSRIIRIHKGIGIRQNTISKQFLEITRFLSVTPWPTSKNQKSRNPEEEILSRKKPKKNKTFIEKKIKQKSEWGIVDVYRFITLEKFASAMGKTDGKFIHLI